MKPNRNKWSFKHEFHPNIFPSTMIEAKCGMCGHLSYFVTRGFYQSANYCSYCGAKMSEEEADHGNPADISADCDEEGSWEKFAEWYTEEEKKHDLDNDEELWSKMRREEEKSWKKRATVHVYKCHRQKQ